MDGGAIGQMVGGHIGGMSNVLLHNGTFCPFVHLHSHSALASETIKRPEVKIPRINIWNAVFILFSFQSIFSDFRICAAFSLNCSSSDSWFAKANSFAVT